MITHEVQVSTLRFFENDNASVGQDPYDAVATLIWIDEQTVWMKAFHGKLSRKLLRDLLRLLINLNVKTLRAQRAEGHTIPGAIDLGDGLYELDVGRLAARVKHV